MNKAITRQEVTDPNNKYSRIFVKGKLLYETKNDDSDQAVKESIHKYREQCQ